MKRLISIFLLVAVICNLSSTAFASCFGDFFLTNQKNVNKATIDRKIRIQYAKLILKGVTSLDDAIPELSPAENTWLDKEFASGAKRHNLAFDSVENQKRMGKNFTKELIKCLNIIINGEFTTKKQEVLCWAIIATDIIGYGYPRVIKNLINMKVVSANVVPGATLLPDIEDSISSECDFQAGEIMRHIVIPYLNDKLPN